MMIFIEHIPFASYMLISFVTLVSYDLLLALRIKLRNTSSFALRSRLKKKKMMLVIMKHINSFLQKNKKKSTLKIMYSTLKKLFSSHITKIT
jgi:hypothetical protein